MTPVRAFTVGLHAAGLWFRATAAILQLLDVDRLHQTNWQWKEQQADSAPDPPSAQPMLLAVDETAVKMGGKWKCVYAAIDVDTKLLLDIAVFSSHSTDPAAAFLHGFAENHDVKDAVFLSNGFGYSTTVSRLGLSGRLDYTTRNLIENGYIPSKCASTVPYFMGGQSCCHLVMVAAVPALIESSQTASITRWDRPTQVI